MSVATRLLAWMYKLPPAETYNIAVDKNLAVPMPDGAVLCADRYYPRSAPQRPTLLVHTLTDVPVTT